MYIGEEENGEFIDKANCHQYHLLRVKIYENFPRNIYIISQLFIDFTPPHIKKNICE
jgi:hypothetical protein